jgi:Uma2 family endonuclease
MITSLQQLDFSKHYTYSDYLLWQFKERVELLKGRLLPMAAPNVQHQRISSYLHTEIGNCLRGKKCDLFSAPFDVRLPLPKNKIIGDKIDTVVQPDLCVVCDESKLDKQGCIGAPELVIEILSQGNAKREMKDKYELYEEAGVMEYWIVDPERRVVLVYLLDEASGKFMSKTSPLTDEDTLSSHTIKGLTIPLNDIFPKETVS